MNEKLSGTVTEEGYDLRGFHPERVVNWGFQFSIANLDNPEGQSAREVLADIDLEIKSFQGSARQFLSTLRMYAVSLGHGLRSRNDYKASRIAGAKARLEKNVEHLGSDEFIGGFMSGGWKLLLLGGLVFLLTNFVMVHYIGRSNEGHKTDPVLTPLATAIGMTFLGASWRSMSIRKKLRKLWTDYDSELASARDEYIKNARDEYNRCAENAAAEWQRFFGQEAPSSKAATSLIFGLARMDMSSESAGAECLAPKAGFWQKIPLVRSFMTEKNTCRKCGGSKLC
ncbi:MAG: hypothetical protein K2X27_13965 [Candidatus Obscuribacterales bacterium]|nr:hypothetical protein [Candidatus Obscuribacterales bacterium]